MKQHPIDDLFARKLNEHSSEPRRATWDEMQKRLHPTSQRERRIGGIWWYATAASVVLTGLAGWWIWQLQTEQPLEGQVQLAIKAKKEIKIARPALPERIVLEEQSDSRVLAIIPKEEKQNRNRSQADKRPAVSSTPDIATPQPLIPQQDLPVVASVTSSIQGSPNQATQPLGETASTVSAPARTLVVQLDEPVLTKTESYAMDGITDEAPKKKRLRLGRLVRQLNNWREGDPVNLKDAGIDPGTILAKATDKLEDKKEKISESYEHLRTKTFREN